MYVSNISTATEHTEPNINAATEHIRIGPCILHWSQVSNLELGVLRNLHLELQDRIRMPFSFERLLRDCLDDRNVTQSRSWSSCVEGTARCVAAFQAATDATEHSQCNEIAAKLCSYATALAQRTSPYLREHFLALVYEYIQNRTHDLAVKNVLNGAFLEHHRFWSCVSDGSQRNACLTIIEICSSTLHDEGQFLRDKICRP